MDKLPVMPIEIPNAKPAIPKEAEGLDYYRIIFAQRTSVERFNDEISRQLKLIGAKFPAIGQKAESEIKALADDYEGKTAKTLTTFNSDDEANIISAQNKEKLSPIQVKQLNIVVHPSYLIQNPDMNPFSDKSGAMLYYENQTKELQEKIIEKLVPHDDTEVTLIMPNEKPTLSSMILL